MIEKIKKEMAIVANIKTKYTNLIGSIKYKDKLVSKILFGSILKKEITKELLQKNKDKFVKNIKKEKEKINKIMWDTKESIIINKYLSKKLKVLDFVEKIYDIEANKICENYKVNIIPNKEDYAIINKELYYIDIKEYIKKLSQLKENNIQSSGIIFNLFVRKKEVIKILDTIKSELVPELEFEIRDTAFSFSVNNFIINIPNQEYYSLKQLIVLLFHELVHAIRSINHYKIFGTYINF